MFRLTVEGVSSCIGGLHNMSYPTRSSHKFTQLSSTFVECVCSSLIVYRSWDVLPRLCCCHHTLSQQKYDCNISAHSQSFSIAYWCHRHSSSRTKYVFEKISTLLPNLLQSMAGNFFIFTDERSWKSDPSCTPMRKDKDFDIEKFKSGLHWSIKNSFNVKKTHEVIVSFGIENNHWMILFYCLQFSNPSETKVHYRNITI